MDLNELLNKQGGVAKGPEVEDANSEGDILSEGRIIQLVSFLLENVEYGVDILAVHEILRFPEMTRLPNTPDYIKGVVNLRGNVIPILDVRNRFNYPEAPVTDLTRIIVIETNEKLVGLLVDNVYQVVRLPETHIDPPSTLIEGVSEEYIKGIGRLRDRLIVILNISNLLFDKPEEESLQSQIM